MLPVAFISCSIHNRRVQVIRQTRVEGYPLDSLISLLDYRQAMHTRPTKTEAYFVFRLSF